jgi:SH3 domain-containing YSC84-like protein 1
MRERGELSHSKRYFRLSSFCATIAVMRYKQILTLLLLSAATVWAETPVRRLNAAADVLSELMNSADRGIPRELLAKAECVVVVPGLKGGAFFVGAKYGKGFASCRNEHGWSAPGAVRIEQGSFGFQIGGIDTDLVLLVMNEHGAKRLVASQFTLGSQSEVAAGPIGRATSAQTDATMNAEMLSWSRSHGVFAGISVQGATLRQDLDVNQILYGQRYRNTDLLFSSVPWPPAGGELRSALGRFAGGIRQMSEARPVN